MAYLSGRACRMLRLLYTVFAGEDRKNGIDTVIGLIIGLQIQAFF